VDTALGQLLVRVPVHQVQLADRGAAEAVDHERDLVALADYVGEYCTSLDMAGASITLSRLDDEIAGLLAAPAEIAIRTF
jgi:phosphoenolpyruvate---glycerone phosphotransferase subunit DhaK